MPKSGAPASAEFPPAAASAQEAARQDTIVLVWGIDTSEGAYGMPMSIINLRAGGVGLPVASGPGMREMTKEERVRFRAPDGALAAAGYWAGFGVNVLVTQENGWIRILKAIWDEGQDVSATWTYEEEASLAVTDILDYRENFISQAGWTACFEGQHEVTTYRYDIIAEQGMVTADIELVIEDERNAYYTSAKGTGGGTRIGNLLFMELYTTIEDDRQNSVEIWRVDNPTDPGQLHVDGRTFSVCDDN